MKTLFRNICMTLGAAVALGCAHTPPAELTQAQMAFENAKRGLAAEQAPAELFEAKKQLDKAQRIFADDGDTSEVRHYSYLADRQIRIAEAVAQQRVAKAEAEDFAKRQQELATSLAQQRGKQLESAQQEADKERDARLQAEREAAASREELARIAKVAEEERGLVITMQGGILFPSGSASLLPGAADKLNRVAAVLRKSPDRKIVIEGHTDAQGSDTSNLVLSRERAEAVRSYLLSQGVESDRIRAVGMGELRPLAANNSTTGRAENRRVEIVLEGKPTAMIPTEGEKNQ